MKAKIICLVATIAASMVKIEAQTNTFPSSGNVGIATTSPRQQLSVGSYLDIYSGGVNSPTVCSIRASGANNLVLNGGPGGNTYLNFDSGTNIIFGNGSGGIMGFWSPNGDLGIGTTSPLHLLTIQTQTDSDGIWISSNGNQSVFLAANTTPGAWNPLVQAGDAQIMWKGSSTDNANAGGLVLGPWSAGTNGLRIAPSGNVGIGTSNPTQKLSVAGTVQAYAVTVQNNWSDYVFDPGYKLPSLASVEKTIKTEHHLPGIPSAQEVAAKGVNVGDMEAKLLAQIEELTLRQIDQDKMIRAQEARIEELEREKGVYRTVQTP